MAKTNTKETKQELEAKETVVETVVNETVNDVENPVTEIDDADPYIAENVDTESVVTDVETVDGEPVLTNDVITEEITKDEEDITEQAPDDITEGDKNEPSGEPVDLDNSSEEAVNLEHRSTEAEPRRNEYARMFGACFTGQSL